MIASPLYVTHILAQEGLNPNRNLGQNFFINGPFLADLIKCIPLKDRNVWEIGPGLGALTELLLENGATVFATEKDPNMVRILKRSLPSQRLSVTEGDCLRVPNDYFESPFTVAGNLPYCITAEILKKLLIMQPEQMLLMMQKEAADRFFAKPSEKSYMPLGAAYSLYYSVKKLGDISPENYFPSPGVTSSMVYLIEKPDQPADKAAELLSFFNQCFSMRRKTLLNNLSAFRNARAVINSLDLPVSIRAEALTPIQLFQLYQAFKSNPE